ncbi:uncharacterized protein LOC141849743 [Brevipalpus obovatus]|uniref:uncharacterized protein LOC141849743 n=1 Tax=Brevipalpus obovatus TaxID=246614 RepID=UPI003D9F508A
MVVIMMEVDSSEKVIPVQGDQKSTKKKGNKQQQQNRVKRMTFLRGQDGPPLPKANATVVQKFRTFFENMIKDNPDYVVRKDKPANLRNFKKKSTGNNEGLVESMATTVKVIEKDEKSMEPNKLKEEIIFGLQSIMRKIRNRKVVGVVLSDPVTIHLQSSLNDMCVEYQIPFLLLPKLDTMKSILKISKMTCIAFSESVIQPHSICHNLYRIFQDAVSTLSQKSQEVYNVDPCLISNPPPEQLLPIVQDELEPKSREPETLKFVYPPLEELMILTSEEDVYLPLSLASKRETSSIPPSINSGAGFIPIKMTNDSRFPHRSYFNDYDFNLCLDLPASSSSSQSANFAKSLFSPSDSRCHSGDLLTKKNQAKTVFRDPKIVHLPASGKSKARKDKKKKS